MCLNKYACVAAVEGMELFRNTYNRDMIYPLSAQIFLFNKVYCYTASLCLKTFLQNCKKIIFSQLNNDIKLSTNYTGHCLRIALTNSRLANYDRFTWTEKCLNEIFIEEELPEKCINERKEDC